MSSGVDVPSAGQLLFKWAVTNKDKLAKAYFLDGGFEGWVQVELAILFGDAGITVAREQHVFARDRSRKIDLLIGGLIGLEIKCETHATKDFYGMVSSDIDKLVEQRPQCAAGVLAFASTATINKLGEYMQYQQIDFRSAKIAVFEYDADRTRSFALIVY